MRLRKAEQRDEVGVVVVPGLRGVGREQARVRVEGVAPFVADPVDELAALGDRPRVAPVEPYPPVPDDDLLPRESVHGEAADQCKPPPELSLLAQRDELGAQSRQREVVARGDGALCLSLVLFQSRFRCFDRRDELGDVLFCQDCCVRGRVAVFFGLPGARAADGVEGQGPALGPFF